MTQKEQDILKLLKSFLNGEIEYRTLDNNWLEMYIEDESDTQYDYEETYYEIDEFIYWGSESEPTSEEKSYGVLSPEELKNKINAVLKKHSNLDLN